MKNLLLSTLALITFFAAVSVQAQVAPDQARNFQINETHTGSMNSVGLEPPLKQKWSVNFGQDISYPLIADGKVFVTVRNASAYGTKLYALDNASGSTLWSVPVSGTYYWSGLCYENGRVFVVNFDGMLRAFDASNGILIWSRQLPVQYWFNAPPTVFQGVIYVDGAGSSGTAYAVSADTGTVIWSKQVNGSGSSPAVTTSGVYLSFSCPNVYDFSPVNGTLVWKYSSTNCSSSSGQTPALYNGRLYVRDSNLGYIYDSQTGGIAGSFLSSRVPAFSGNMGFFLNGTTLQGKDINSNLGIWNFTGDGFLQSSVIVVNNYVYVGSDKGKLYAVNAATGQSVWSTTAGTSIPYVDERNLSQPTTGFAAGEGILVIPTKTTLVAYEGDHTPTITWGSQTPAVNSYGWNTTPVEVTFQAFAHPSGVTFSTPGSPIQFNAEGANQTQQVTVSDQSNNSATFTSPAVNIDWTAPVTTRSLSGTFVPGITAWYASAVQVSLTASDPVSGIRSTSYNVDGGATQTYVGPFSISNDGSHTVVYWSLDIAGNTEAQQTVFVNVDKVAPSTQASVSGTASDDGWYHESVQVTLTATDATSGVANSYYTIDGGATLTYTAPFTVSADGSHIINYWSVDAVGNTETSHSLTVKIDVSAPSTQLSVSGTAGTNGWYVSPNAQISLAPADGLSGVASTYYTVDGGTAQTYAGPFTLSGNAEHQVSFWSVDKVGNTEAQQSSAVKIDNTGPTTQNAVEGPAGNSTYFAGAVQFSLTASDSLSGVANTFYRIDGGPTQTYSTPFTVSGDGTHPVDFWSVDLAGNNPGFATVMIRIDATAPTTQAAISGTPGANGWYNAPVQISLTASDNLAGIAATSYAVDGGLPQTYTAPFTISTTGTHSVIFWSTDQCNNTESQQSAIVKVDLTAPSTQLSVSGNSGNGWYQNPAQISLNASDSSSGVANSYYSLDGGATQTYAGPFNVSGAGSHVISYWSVDAVGNGETHQSAAVKIDTGAPSTLSSSSGTVGNNGWYRSSAQVSLTASDSQAGVGSTFYTLDGGATQTYAGPFSINTDGQHQLSYWSVDRVGNTETPKSAVIKIDVTGPTTQSAISGPAGTNNYFRGAVQVSLSATDNLSGVVSTYYRKDGGTTRTYSSAFSVSGDGTHTVDSWSVDGAGNTAAAVTVTIRIDSSAPSTQVTASGTTGTNGWYRSPVQVTLTASDSFSGVSNRFYTIDGGATQTYSAPFIVSAAGVHTINYWSVDQANNAESAHSLSVSIDANGPVMTASANPSTAAKSVFSVSVTVSGSITDTPSGVKSGTSYSVVDEYGVTHPSGSVTVQTNGSYSFKLTLPATRNAGDSDGHLYTITIQASDKAGNTGTKSTTVRIL